jgi:hypothetical protein
MKKCESCTSCGMPFKKSSDHALGDELNPYCIHCAHVDGTLKSYQEVLEATQGYFIHAQGLDPEAALKMADNLLKKQPDWLNKKN